MFLGIQVVCLVAQSPKVITMASKHKRKQHNE